MEENPEDSGNSKPREESFKKERKINLRDWQQSKKFRGAVPP